MSVGGITDIALMSDGACEIAASLEARVILPARYTLSATVNSMRRIIGAERRDASHGMINQWRLSGSRPSPQPPRII